MFFFSFVAHLLVILSSVFSFLLLACSTVLFSYNFDFPRHSSHCLVRYHMRWSSSFSLFRLLIRRSLHTYLSSLLAYFHFTLPFRSHRPFSLLSLTVWLFFALCVWLPLDSSPLLVFACISYRFCSPSVSSVVLRLVCLSLSLHFLPFYLSFFLT